MLIATTESKAVVVSRDGGASWARRSQVDIDTIWGGSTGPIWGLDGWLGIHEAAYGFVYRSTDDGLTWVKHNVATPVPGVKLRAAHIPLDWVRGDSKFPEYVSARPSELVRPTLDPPQQWSRIEVPCPDGGEAYLSGRIGGTVFVTCRHAVDDSIARSSDEGRSWQFDPIGGTVVALNCRLSRCLIVTTKGKIGEVAERSDGIQWTYSVLEPLQKAKELGCDTWTRARDALIDLGWEQMDVPFWATSMSIHAAVPLRGGVVIAGNVSLPSGRPIAFSALVIRNTVSWGLAGAYGAWSEPSGAVWLFGPGATSFTPDDAGPGGK